MAKDGDDIKLAFLCLAMGGTLVLSGIKRIRRKRLVEDTPHIDIASAPQGMAEIQAFAWPIRETVPTIQGRKALYRSLELQEYVKRGKEYRWETQWSNTFNAPFYVIDGTGVLYVDPRDAELECNPDIWDWSKISGAMRAQAMGLGMQAAGFPPNESLLFGMLSSRFRLVESAILLGAPVYLHGTLTSGKRAGERLPASLPLERFRGFIARLGKKRIASQLSFDRNKDRMVCDKEAATGMNSIGENAYSPSLAFNEKPPLPGEAPPENQIFGEITSCAERKLYIANCHQEHLLKRIGGNNFLTIVGGALLMGGGALILAWKFLP